MINLSAFLLALPLALALIVLHSLDGHEVTINPAHVTHLLAAKHGVPNKLFVEGVNCVINLADGKLVTVAETCDVVRQRLESAK